MTRFSPGQRKEGIEDIIGSLGIFWEQIVAYLRDSNGIIVEMGSET